MIMKFYIAGINLVPASLIAAIWGADERWVWSAIVVACVSAIGYVTELSDANL
jgi:hypothetical protein